MHVNNKQLKPSVLRPNVCQHGKYRGQPVYQHSLTVSYNWAAGLREQGYSSSQDCSECRK